MELSRQELIKTVIPGGGHLVILGAGASHALASTNNGDKNGKPLPVMNDLINVAGVDGMIKELGYAGVVNNFEAVYSELALDHTPDELKPLNDKIADYFGDIEIPDGLTNYDYLLAGLRPRDLIATFNWDPLLVQAYQRLQDRGLAGKLPRVVFLHGNVAIGYCSKDGVASTLESHCPKCFGSLTRTPLLYPVAEKNYEDNEFIKGQWDAVRSYMKIARVVTVYGYSAPVTDVAAIALLQDGWGKNTDRQFEQFELIVRPGADEQEARKAWSTFIHTHHYHVVDDIMKSYIAKVPRRGVELWHEQNLEAKFVEDNPFPNLATLDELREWVQPLIDAEDQD